MIQPHRGGRCIQALLGLRFRMTTTTKSGTGISRYLQVYRVLSQAVAEGLFGAGEPLPSEPRLIEGLRRLVVHGAARAGAAGARRTHHSPARQRNLCCLPPAVLTPIEPRAASTSREPGNPGVSHHRDDAAFRSGAPDAPRDRRRVRRHRLAPRAASLPSHWAGAAYRQPCVAVVGRSPPPAESRPGIHHDDARPGRTADGSSQVLGGGGTGRPRCRSRARCGAGLASP